MNGNINNEQSLLSRKAVISCFSPPTFLSNNNLMDNSSRFFIDTGQVKEVKGRINQFFHQLKLWLGIIREDWGESRQAEMKTILRSVLVELRQVVHNNGNDFNKLSTIKQTLYTNEHNNYVIKLDENNIIIEQIRSIKSVPIESTVLLRLTKIEDYRLFIGELLNQHNPNIQWDEATNTFIRTTPKNPAFTKHYLKDGVSSHYKFCGSNNLQVEFPINRKDDINNQVEIIDSDRSMVKIYSNKDIVKKCLSYTDELSCNATLKLNKLFEFIHQRENKQIIVPMVGKDHWKCYPTLYMPKITKNPNVQLDQLYIHTDKNVQANIKGLYKSLLNEMQDIRCDHRYDDFKLEQLVYGKIAGIDEDNLYLVDNDDGIYCFRSCTAMYSSAVFTDYKPDKSLNEGLIVNNNPSEFNVRLAVYDDGFVFDSNVERFIAILISTVKLYTGFQFRDVYGKNERYRYRIYNESLEHFLNVQELRDGVYSIKVDDGYRYFQVVDGAKTALTLKNSSQDMSIFKDKYTFHNNQYSEIFNGYIRKNDPAKFYETLKDTIKPDKLVEIQTFVNNLITFNGCNPYLVYKDTLDNFLNAKNLQYGVYSIRVDDGYRYFQVITGKVNELILKNPSQDMSIYKDDPEIRDETYVSLFNGYTKFNNRTQDSIKMKDITDVVDKYSWGNSEERLSGLFI